MKAMFKKATFIFSLIAIMATAVAVPVFAWFYRQRELAAYAPISSPESLYIGAGHTEGDFFEDIRYLYFDAIDAEKDDVGDGYHWDRVFCVYGKMVSGYRLQLGFTTNNQFTYEIYNATESLVSSAGAVAHTTHATTPVTYYYSVNGAAIAGRYLNKAAGDEILANDDEHEATYDEYDNVHKYAEPIYWQTTGLQVGNARGDFVNYYILRVRLSEDIALNRETDVICISAKTFST